MSIDSARRRFGATPYRGRSTCRPHPWILASFARFWACVETPCILLAVTLANLAIVKIVDALLDALHN
ncbi:hypothetical protein [Methylocystis parvus]|uniref:Uncharacterized protein n=1 Tax=Methylocystis parvus TaxID=134 RepID=A0A6B8LZ76_9HYPH|nr:hypothetical protein [Methylocystis parvus]QGM96764.1 hypothetical protein F7D14_04270 [Methylocystis parvus]WBJ99361.1 hypothetical protein MMG94_15355 [Methylocystis parvus OBBP]